MIDILSEDVGALTHTPGYRVRIMRKEKGLKQEELAEALNRYPDVSISTSMISNYESNKFQPQPATWDALADFFSVSIDWLRCRSEIRNPDQQLAALNFPEDVLELARKLNALPTGWVRELSSYVDELAEEITKVRASQIKRLKKRAEEEPGFEKRVGVKITN